MRPAAGGPARAARPVSELSASARGVRPGNPAGGTFALTLSALSHGYKRCRFHLLVDLRNLVALDRIEFGDGGIKLLLQLFHPQDLRIGRPRRRARDRSAQRLNLLAEPRILPISHPRIGPRQLVLEQVPGSVERAAGA